MTQPPPPYSSYPAAQPPPVAPPPPLPVAPPPPAGRWRPEGIDPMPGTDFGLVRLRVEPITSGLAIGSLIVGVGAILVSLLVFCFGLAGSSDGWGGWVSGAFTVLSVLAGAGAVGVGLGARRQIRHSGRTGQVRFTGRGLAIAGISCGAAGAGIAFVGLALSLLLQLSA